MNIKSNAATLIALVLASSAKAALLDDILPKPQAPPGTNAESTGPTNPPGPGTGTSTTTASTTPAGSILPTIPSILPTTSSANQTIPISTISSVAPTTDANTSSRVPVSTSLSVTATTTTSISPTPTQSQKDTGSSTQLATAGIVVGAVVVAAAIGIWVFRKWKLSPSRDFQSKIRGDEYADTDYPRSYENDTVRLHHMNDQPAEPAAAKSPYSANTAFPVEDQYYDANYASKDQSGGYGQSGYNDYGRGAAPGYDQGGYDHGYNDHNNYGNDGYAQSNVGGYGHDSYAQSQVGSGYGGNQGAYNQGGYAPSQVGGGYQQHGGYDDFGRR
ncbi:hypothetical protein BGZ47_004247 [Haplosporangium gracile]|nr:hypothetical protein BGZ47_004247 [Haplosporangium gracile]